MGTVATLTQEHQIQGLEVGQLEIMIGIFLNGVFQDASGGDFSVLAHSIHTQLWPLDPSTIVYPGHGPMTTIGHEKETNPFVGDSSGTGSYTIGKYS